MKSAVLFLALLVFGFASCTKQYDDELNTPAYHVDGVTDLTLIKGSRSGGSTPGLQLSVVYENSQQERVHLTLENVPTGLYYKFYTPTGIPTFSSFVSFADSGVAEGNYSMRVVATGENSGRRELVFNMEVTGQPDCSADLIGSGYLSNSSCTSGSFSQSITKATGFTNNIILNNFDNNGTSLRAVVDCDFQQLTIPLQTINGVTYSGNGSYGISGGQRFISLSVQKSSSGGGTNFCSYSLQK